MFGKKGGWEVATTCTRTCCQRNTVGGGREGGGLIPQQAAFFVRDSKLLFCLLFMHSFAFFVFSGWGHLDDECRLLLSAKVCIIGMHPVHYGGDGDSRSNVSTSIMHFECCGLQWLQCLDFASLFS